MRTRVRQWWKRSPFRRFWGLLSTLGTLGSLSEWALRLGVGSSIGLIAAISSWLLANVHVAIVIGVAAWLAAEIALTLRWKRASYRPDQVKTFEHLCLRIKPLVDANAEAFRRFGPNSRANSAGPVRWDPRLWHKARLERIVPNNALIENLLTHNRQVIPPDYLPAVDAELAHIYAFRKHCEDRRLDYREYQFPNAFSQLIDDHAGEA